MTDLDSLVVLLNQAAALANTVRAKAPDGQLSYDAMMWADYLAMFSREASAHAKEEAK